VNSVTGPITRRNFNAGAAALLGASLGTAAFGQAKASGRVVVGTWGGDYQKLQQLNIVDTLMTPAGVETVFDTANDTVRKTKLMAEKPLPRGSMDVVALTGQGSYEMWKNNVLEEIDESKVPNIKHVPQSLRVPYGIPTPICGIPNMPVRSA
jgi:putative spermidine/putrescine transport system substrate-binding protein